MKTILIPTLCLGLLASTAAIAQQHNPFHSNYQVRGQMASQATAQESFERIVHPNDLGACVGEVANACDQQAPQKIVAALVGRPVTAIAESSYFNGALRTRGVQTCAHITSGSGATSTDVFLRQRGQQTFLVVYKSSRSNACRASEMALPSGVITKMEASKFRAWFISSTGQVFYMLPSSTVKQYKAFRNATGLNISADGNQIQILSGSSVIDSLTDEDIRLADTNPTTMEREQPVTSDVWKLLVE